MRRRSMFSSRRGYSARCGMGEVMHDAVLTFESEPDALGRRAFTITWTEPNGVYRRELARDGAPVGYRRGQCFRAVPDDYVRRVIASGGEVKYG
jgi:hypothetical protein